MSLLDGTGENLAVDEHVFKYQKVYNRQLDPTKINRRSILNCCYYVITDRNIILCATLLNKD